MSNQGALRELLPGIDDGKWEQLGRYYELLVDWNSRMNLTSIVEEDEVYVKHFYDSLLIHDLPLWQEVQPGARVADIGTGAGFPGLVLAICNPDLQFVLFDALNKRIRFLEAVCSELGLANVQLVHGRAEDIGQDRTHRQTFDLVVSRAVARLNVLLELALPLVRVNGLFVAYKGPSAVEEVTEAKLALTKLGGGTPVVEERELPLEMGQRYFIVVPKKHPTSKDYPRKAGTPQKQPL